MDVRMIYSKEILNFSENIYTDKYFVMTYIHSGEGYVCMGNNVFEIRKGCVILTKSQEIIQIYNEKNKKIRFSNIYISEKSLLDLLIKINKAQLINIFIPNDSSSVRIIVNHDNRNYFELTLKIMYTELGESEATDYVQFGLMLSSLIINCSRCSHSVIMGIKTENQYYKILAEEFDRYISQNIEKELTVNGLAKHLNLTPSYISRIFKNIMGISFREYVFKIKLSRAQVLLIDNTLTIENVSEKCGFKTVQHFSRVFKEFVGITALDYRKKILNN